MKKRKFTLTYLRLKIHHNTEIFSPLALIGIDWQGARLLRVKRANCYGRTDRWKDQTNIYIEKHCLLKVLEDYIVWCVCTL